MSTGVDDTRSVCLHACLSAACWQWLPLRVLSAANQLFSTSSACLLCLAWLSWLSSCAALRCSSARRPKAPPGSNGRLKVEVSLAMHADSTMAVEVGISEALLNWPYFQDLSLVSAQSSH